MSIKAIRKSLGGNLSSITQAALMKLSEIELQALLEDIEQGFIYRKGTPDYVPISPGGVSGQETVQ